MRSIIELRDKALTTGVNTLLPLYSKGATKVTELAETPVGRKVVEYAGMGLAAAAPVVERVEKLVRGHNGDSPAPEVKEVTPKPATAKKATPKAKSAKSAKTIGTKSVRKPTGSPASKSAKKVAPVSGRPTEDIASVKATEPVETPSGAPIAGIDTAPAAIDLPLPGYDALVADEIVARMEGLTQSDLATLFAYEKAHDNRTTILSAIEGRLVDLPLPTYDSLEVSGVVSRLDSLNTAELRTVRDYEAATLNRLPIIEKVDELLSE
jgi:hypothetical protein